MEESDRIRENLREFWKGEIRWNVPLSGYTTFRVGGPALALVSPATIEGVKNLVDGCSRAEIPWLVIGRGSNVLAPDHGFPGVIMVLGNDFSAISEAGVAGDGRYLVEVESGCSLSRLLNWSKEHDLTGLEFTAGIPGTVGGAVVMNAGAWGREIKDVVTSLNLLESGNLVTMNRGDLRFAYRCWLGPEDAIVLTTTFALQRGESSGIGELCRQYIEARKVKQPKQPSGGSFFKNPEGRIAGKLIEEAGLKGTRVGGAMVSDLHANFIINTGSATATDIFNLMEIIQDKVHDVFGVILEPEVKILKS